MDSNLKRFIGMLLSGFLYSLQDFKAVFRSTWPGLLFSVDTNLQCLSLQVNCYETRSFWISWTDNVLRVGTGSLLTHTLISYADPDPIFPLNYVSFTSWSTASGEWELEQEEGKATAGEWELE